MRIVMVLASGFYPDRRTLKETESLRALGHEVAILAWDRGAELPVRETLACGATVRRFRLRSAYGSGLVQLPGFLRFWWWAIRETRRLRADAVQCHDLDAAPVGLALGGRCRFTYDPHEPSYARRAASTDSRAARFGKAIVSAAIVAFERLVVRAATHTLATNPFHAGKYLSWGARNVIEVANYPPPGLTAVPTDRTDAGSSVVFGTVGGLRPGTGLELMIDAARIIARLGRRDIRLEISGFGTYPEYEHRLRDRARGLENLAFDVANDPGRLAERLSRLDVVCVLYDPDIENYRLNVATRLFDAMAVERPALVTDAGWSAYLVRTLDLGFLLTRYTAEDLAALMVAIAGERSRLPEIGRAAFEAFRAHYTWKQSEAVLATLYGP